MELNKNGLNAALTASILSSRQDMRTLGFMERSGAVWGLCRHVGNGITLDLSIPKDGSPFLVNIVNEINGQSYDYERALEIDPANTFASGVQKDVDEILEFLTRIGILRGFKKGMSIYSPKNSDIDIALYETLC